MSFLLRPTLRTSALASSTRAFSSSRASQLARMTVIGRLGAAPEEFSVSSGDRTLVKDELVPCREFCRGRAEGLFDECAEGVSLSLVCSGEV
jgi:hypothetical protein